MKPKHFTILPVLVICLFVFNSCSQDVESNQIASSSKMENSVGTASNNVKARKSNKPGAKELQEKGIKPSKVAKKNQRLKGSNYFNFTPKSTEARLADYLETPIGNPPKSFFLETVKFKHGSSNFEKSSQQQLSNVAKLLAAYQSVKIDIVVYPDVQSNSTLEEKRATKVQEYFTNIGLPETRIGVQKANSRKKPAAVELIVTQK